MQDFVENWKSYLYGMWLGGSIPVVFGTGMFDPRFWFVALPTVVLVTLFNRSDRDQE